MKLYNSMTGKKEEFIPVRKGKVSMYVCGPTVYNHAHIGNTRPMIVFDILQRLFKHLGYEVTYVSNYTDIDDKIIKKAIKENVDEKVIANTYIEAYEAVRKQLNVNNPDVSPRVLNYMEGIISYISDLINNNHAYVVDGDVYFSVDSIDNYGELSNQKKDELDVGARVEENKNKRNPKDFTLWKKTDIGVKFNSPWSQGRPGWHTECIVMIDDIFEGGAIDIHGGGLDLKFPHHENEIAQAVAHSNHKVANFWMHSQLLNLNNEKMSKSKGNVLLAKDVLSNNDINVFKWLMISTHYLKPLNYNDDNLDFAAKEVDKVYDIIRKVSMYKKVNEINNDTNIETENLINFVNYLSDDLNTSMALSIIIDEIKQINKYLRSKDNEKLLNHYNSLMKMLDLLGFNFIEPEINEIDLNNYYAWKDAVANKDYESADKYRQYLLDKGLI